MKRPRALSLKWLDMPAPFRWIYAARDKMLEILRRRADSALFMKLRLAIVGTATTGSTIHW